MKFCWATLRVENLEESLKFYQGIVGLRIENRFTLEPDKEIVFLGDGETKIELIGSGLNQEKNMGQDISLGFGVDSVDKMIEFIKEKGLEVEGGPFQPTPNIKFFYVKDPDGLKIQFVEN